MSRPELTGPAEVFYDSVEARKYTSSSRIINVQAEIASRCIELLNLESEKRFILDIGCGSGLSGAALEAAGHEWVGCDISRDMLRIASERAKASRGPVEMDDDEEEDSEEEEDDDEEEDSEEEEEDDDDDEAGMKRRRVVASAELVQHDMGLGLPFREGMFDGAISVSALQWLCYDNAADQSATRRLARFFGSLYRCLKKGGRAALQFYPQDEAQATLIASAASKAGFAGGIVVDFPNSSKAKKHYLCLSMDRAYRKPAAKEEDAAGGAGRPKRGKDRKSRKKDREWVIQKKEHQRRLGRDVRPDTKFTGRKRKDRF
ncbi:hypothetical protein CTAYLR_000235 [Chrysophaeum taylorii]|uniref:Uncharacterized protein n=1 Tax=Chrysophaeum taylorii TaxID=2483200 RepID=A0AAD7XL12_9STRA|nr:hypothetical protein CTAYLR_000235 [Chrysophaeum taylorii]